MSRLVRLTRRRLLLGLAAIALLGLALWEVYRLEVWEFRGPFWDRYEKVKLGMTEEEAEAILGPPAVKEFPGGGLGPSIYSWIEGQQMIEVVFSQVGSAGWGAVSKQFWPGPDSEGVRDPPETWRERIRPILKALGL